MRWSVRLVTHVVCLVIWISLADLALVSCLVVNWFSEQAAWEAACWIAEAFWGYMQHHWETTLRAGDSLSITGDQLPRGESAIVISNHLAYSDYYLVQALAKRQGMLGRCRYFVKKEIVRLPFFGWAFWAIGMILVSRNWTTDAFLVEEAFTRIKRNGHHCWVILYPEGTRRTQRKLAQVVCPPQILFEIALTLYQSQDFARTSGKPAYRHLLNPRTKGFISTVQSLQGSHIQFLYDLTFLYAAPGCSDYRAPSLDEQLSCNDLAQAGFQYRVHVRRIALDMLPGDTEGLKRWCEQAWSDKDDWLDTNTREREKGDL